MAVTEEARHRLYNWALQAGGPEVAATLMELLPPVGWADVATKQDLDLRLGALEERMQLRLDSGLNGLRTEMHMGFAAIERELRVQLYWIVGLLVSAVGVMAAVARLG